MNVAVSFPQERDSYTSLPGLRCEPFVVTIIESEVMAQPARQMVVLLVPSCLLTSDCM